MEVAKTLHQLESEIRQNKSRLVMGSLIIGRNLCLISEGNLWVQSDVKSFEAYCEGELGFKKTWAYGLMGAYEKYGRLINDNPDLQTIDVTRVIKLLPVTTDDNKEELIHTAANIPDVKGFDNFLRELKGKMPTDAPHECEWEEWRRCKICGKMEKVHK